MNSPHPAPTHPKRNVPFSQQFAWGCGGMADNFILNVVAQLVLPIYNVGLGINAIWLGVALGIPRIIDAFLDPLMGVVSDNTRSRFGRRRHYIVIGAVLSALMVFLLYLPSTSWNKHFILGYFIVAICIYSVSYTIFCIPYTALGFELSPDYEERTKVLAWRMYLGLAGGFAIPWFYKLCLLPIFGGTDVQGVKWVAGGLAIIIAIMGSIPGLFCRELESAQHQATIGFKAAIAQTAKNKAFVVLMTGYFVFLLGLSLTGSLVFYVNLFYVYAGDKSATGTLTGWSQTAYIIGAILALPLAALLGRYWSKRQTILFYTACALIGYASFWFTFSKTIPYAQIGSQFFVGFGQQGFWLMISSMIADICDEDELVTGLRREGAFGAVYSFVNKGAIGVATLFSGLILAASGYVEGHTPSPATLLWLKILFVFVQVAGIAIAFAITIRFPITREKALKTEALLRERREQAALAGVPAGS